jgi:SNF2 family DNA or RNA helicase
MMMIKDDDVGRMLLKQGPYGGQPVLRRILIVTPSSLVVNWQNEFLRWLGQERVQTFVIDQVILRPFFVVVITSDCTKS